MVETLDLNGNIVEDIDELTSLPREFIFNGDNKQTEVKRDGVTIGRYYYDGEGRRVKKVTDTETTVFVYAAGQLIAEYSTAISQTPSVSYTTADHLGSPRVITNELGQVSSRRDFMPFGEELYAGVGTRTGDTGLKYSSSDDDIRQKFTGYQKDNETNLDFAEARMYSNNYGRFTAVDPLLASGKSSDPQTFNRYVYVRNAPLIMTDPTGLMGEFYDENGNPIGTDGKPDRKIYLVTDGKERERIAKSKGPYTETVKSALELPSFEVRQEIGVAAVQRSDAGPNGGFHEEGGTVWEGADGNQLAIPAKPGEAVDVLTAEKASINVFDAADPKLTEKINPNSPDLLTTYHVHPSGVGVPPKELKATNEVVIGRAEVIDRRFGQNPSKRDVEIYNQGPAPKLGYKIVVGARDQRVYFYRGNGNRSRCNCVASMPLSKFTSIR